MFQPAAVRRLLFVCFWISIAFFSFGQVFVIGGPLLCLGPLILLYLIDWKNCTLAKVPIIQLFLSIFFFSILIQYLLSEWHNISFATVKPNIFRAFVLPFIGMECSRTEKNLKWLVVAFCFSAFFQGLDGVWQYITGFDLIKKAPIMTGRLTGSFGTYRVGDYLGIILVPASAITLLVPKNKILMTICLISPGIFLWIFAQARMGYMALVLSLYVVWLSSKKRIDWQDVILPLTCVLLLILFGPSRIALERALADPRGELWITAWQTMQHHLWFGTGNGTFVPALVQAGFDLPLNGLGVQHPHNAYLQFLVDGGLFGFFTMMFVLCGSTLWTWRQIPKHTENLFWRLAIFFWAGWLAYLIVLIGGHDFYRTWFLSTGMTLLGIVYGACVVNKTSLKS